jgi:hypothetical protein
MAYVAHADSGGLHCVFTRQPKTAQEIERAIGAMCESDVCGIRYGGTDPAILRRIAARGGCADGGTDALLPSKATAARVTLRAGLWFALIAVLIGALLVLLSGVD